MYWVYLLTKYFKQLVVWINVKEKLKSFKLKQWEFNNECNLGETENKKKKIKRIK